MLKAYGSVPEIKNTSQLAEFSSTLQDVRDSSIFEVKPYLYPDGPIVDYGSGPMPGYFLIKLYDYEGSRTIYSENELKEIYNIVKKITRLKPDLMKSRLCFVSGINRQCSIFLKVILHLAGTLFN